jgi:hypothetical protein
MPEYASRTRIRKKKGFDDPAQFIPDREIKEALAGSRYES